MSEFKTQVDVRQYEKKDKQSAIFNAFDGLKPGEQMELINDHDPKPLRNKFNIEREGKFQWEYIEEGSVLWRIAIKKL